MTTQQTQQNPRAFDEVVDNIETFVEGAFHGARATVGPPARRVHGATRSLVRWIIVLVSLFPFILAIPAGIRYELAQQMVPIITIGIVIPTTLFIAFRWDNVVTGLVELGIVTAGLSRLQGPSALKTIGSAAGALKDFGVVAFRWVAKVIGLELLVGIYFTFVPVANAREWILPLALLMTTTVSLFLGKVNQLAAIPIILLLGLTGVFFAGGMDEAAEWVNAQVDPASEATSTDVPSGCESSGDSIRCIVTLKGEDALSDVVVNMDDLPPHTTCKFEAPVGTRVHLDNGVSKPLTGDTNFGTFGGEVRLTGPKGEEAGLRCPI